MNTWDTDLAVEALRRLSPGDKGRRSTASLTRKIDLLRDWAKNGLPQEGNTTVPTDRAKLRRWHEPSLGLWAWSDPVIDAPDGRNAVLMEQFAVALEAIERLGKRKDKDPRKELEAARILIAGLEKQNLRLIDQNRRLQAMVAAGGIERR